MDDKKPESRAQEDAQTKAPSGHIAPTPRQQDFIRNPARDVMYGGGIGGGKSFALVLDALGQIHEDGYNAILLRRTFAQLKSADGLEAVAQSIYGRIGGEYHKSDYMFTFQGNPGTIRLGHMNNTGDEEKYDGSAYAYVGYDEAQSFTAQQLLYLFSRNRTGSPGVNLYYRMTGMPSPRAVSKAFLRARYVDAGIADEIKYFAREDGRDVIVSSGHKRAVSRCYIPALLDDNPYLINTDYESGLFQMDSNTTQALRWGDWAIQVEGRVYYAFQNQIALDIALDDQIPPLNDPRWTGFYTAHDFGAENRVWLLIGRLITGHYVVLFEQPLPEMTTVERAERIKETVRGLKVIRNYGGAPSETQIRRDYRQANLTIVVPDVTDVESQVNGVNQMFKHGLLLISSACTALITDLEECARKEDGSIDKKSIYHYSDALRYFAAGVSQSLGLGIGAVGPNRIIASVQPQITPDEIAEATEYLFPQPLAAQLPGADSMIRRHIADKRVSSRDKDDPREVFRKKRRELIAKRRGGRPSNRQDLSLRSLLSGWKPVETFGLRRR